MASVSFAAPAHAPSPLGWRCWRCSSLTGQPTAEVGVDGAQLAADLPALLHGQGQHHGDCTRRLSDTALVKLFRLLRLARRLLDLEAAPYARDVSEEAACPTSHPLNQAVIAQALHDLRNGQLRRCKAAMASARPSWMRSSTLR